MIAQFDRNHKGIILLTLPKPPPHHIGIVPMSVFQLLKHTNYKYACNKPSWTYDAAIHNFSTQVSFYTDSFVHFLGINTKMPKYAPYTC